MPSFCPKLESSIKVMHRRMAKNDTKFTKIHFSRDLSLKSGKINFHEFWTIFGHSTVHHLKKTPKNIRKMDLRKKNPFLLKNEKWQIFFLRRAINSTKMVKNSKFFCSITSYAPNDTEKNFCDHWSHIREMNSRFLKKKNVSPNIQMRLECFLFFEGIERESWFPLRK